MKCPNSVGFRIRFTVADSGIGIHRESARSLFSPFTQVDGSTTRKYGGTGLGLSISKQIVNLMGGDIGFQSQPDQGSQFWFTATLEKVSVGGELRSLTPTLALQSKHAPKSPGIDRKKARILAAEDNPTNREVLALMLAHGGYSFEMVENGSEAVRALQSSAYDLVLMDCDMPVMDGIQATMFIRDSRTGVLNPRIPVVAITASAMIGDQEKCIAAGMDDYLSKPLEPECLFHTLDTWLNTTANARPELNPARAQQVSELTLVFDKDAFLKRLTGNRRAAEKVLQAFLGSVPSQLEHLREHALERDATSARRDAHSIKGSAATISASSLRDTALAAERAASTCSWGILETAFASGGQAALDLMAGSTFDVIVTDMRMPGMDGASLLEQVREHHPAVIRIVLSGHTELGTAMRIVPIAHQFLAKPCEQLGGVLEIKTAEIGTRLTVRLPIGKNNGKTANCGSR